MERYAKIEEAFEFNFVILYKFHKALLVTHWEKHVNLKVCIHTYGVL